MIVIEGEYTTAEVMGLDNDQLEDSAREQIKKMVNHEAFRNPVRVMPDTHKGAGSVIGFTMPVGERVVPNVVGVDIGCGMIAVRLKDELDDFDLTHEEIDRRVRDRVPMGWGKEGERAPDRTYHNVHETIDYDVLNDRLEQFVELDSVDAAYVDPMREFLDDGGYDLDYFKELVHERAAPMSYHFDMNTAINQFGTLGGGNHFIELAESAQTGELWVVIHSGSRKLGGNTAEYWQGKAIDIDAIHAEWYRERAEKAHEILAEYPDEYVKFDSDAVSDKELFDWLKGGMGGDFVNYDAIPKEEREEVRKGLKRAVPDDDSPPELDNLLYDSLDYLEGEQAAGYLIDMLFCQEYAVESRKKMAEETAAAIETEIEEVIHARHNIIDFRDGVIRKGATRAYEGERVVVPFNMSAGTLLVEGKSNDEWHCSVCHGAGRVKSRGEAKRTITEEEIREQMEAAGAYATELPLDEAPGAYKDTALIKQAIQPTATIVDRLEVVHNFKAAN